jgi:endonuclease III
MDMKVYATDMAIRRVFRILRRRYKDFTHFNKKDVLGNLIFVICSVRATEPVYCRVYDKLLARYPNVAALGAASVTSIASVIKEAGRQRQKATAIRTAVQLALDTFGKADLEGLHEYSDSECQHFLMRIPWVGLKVARCVMMIPLNRSVFPVDTHVWRVCSRLGWIKRKGARAFCSNAEMDQLQSLIPQGIRKSLHVNMISLGREFCHAGRPKCEPCPLRTFCRTGLGIAPSANKQ